MNVPRFAVPVVLLTTLALHTPRAAHAAPDAPDLAGIWAGTLVHGADSTRFALTIEHAGADTLRILLTASAIHADAARMAKTVPHARADSIECGPFTFAFDAAAGTLSGMLPDVLAPGRRVPFTLRRVDHFELPVRAPLDAPVRLPLWSFDAGAPLWAGTTFADSMVFAGTDSGRVVALDALSGAERWSFHAGGAVRARPAAGGGAVYVQADDGFIYRLDERSGALVWKQPLDGEPVLRRLGGDPNPRFDRFASDAVLWEGHLFVGAHDGRMFALNPRTGHVLWTFLSGGPVLAAPAIERGTLVFGSFDGKVYGLEAQTGRLLWSYDAHAPVVSTPAIYRGYAVIGSRSDQLVALDMRDGKPVWTHEIWMSWVESSAALMDDVAYVGSSDAAAIFAYQVPSGHLMWKTDVQGWSWGQPAATPGRVYVGTAGWVGYPGQDAGQVLALDLVIGEIVWRYPLEKPVHGTFGVTGSASTGLGRVFAAGLDGQVYAFEQ